MKILQLIDTLHPGGAERVALNYANSLLNYNIESHICITREKGILFDELNKNVNTHFLKKKNLFDLLALARLIRIIRNNKIDVVHAHGSSWYFAILCKLFGLKFKLVWHDHYGNSDYLEDRNFVLLKYFSKKIDGIISVNTKLKEWAVRELRCTHVIFLKNFIRLKEDKTEKHVKLKGNSKINLVCVANLRPQKDHYTLISAFEVLKNQLDISLHLFGKSYVDKYSSNILNLIRSTPLVYWYGEEGNIHPFLKQADIGVLSSVSEGLPLALLEYGEAGLAVVCTNVGECQTVIGENGKIINPGDFHEMANSIKFYIKNEKRRIKDSRELQKRIKQLYSEEFIVPEYLEFCRNLC